MEILYPKCHYGYTDPYVNYQGYVIPCCYVATEYDKETKTLLPVTRRDIFDNFNLRDKGFQEILEGDEWKNFTGSLHGQLNAFRKCIEICKTPSDTSGRSTSTNFRRSGLYKSQTIHVEMTSRCTLACLKCARTIRKGIYDVRDLEMDAIKSIASQTIFPEIMLCGGLGDPIFHRYFHEAVELMLENGKDVHVVTCGSGRNTKWWEKQPHYVRNIRIKFGSVFQLMG